MPGNLVIMCAQALGPGGWCGVCVSVTVRERGQCARARVASCGTYKVNNSNSERYLCRFVLVCAGAREFIVQCKTCVSVLYVWLNVKKPFYVRAGLRFYVTIRICCE